MIGHQAGLDLPRAEVPTPIRHEDELAQTGVDDRLGGDGQHVVQAPELDVYGGQHSRLQAHTGVVELQAHTQGAAALVQRRAELATPLLPCGVGVGG